MGPIRPTSLTLISLLILRLLRLALLAEHGLYVLHHGGTEPLF
jgi:hypothetical protein